MDFLRDQIWQFLGAVIALIALSVSIYMFFLQRSKKSLCYQVLTSTELLTVSEEIKGRLKILFDEVPIQSASLIILKIINDGNVPIASSDFERPLNFSYGEDTNILSVEVTEASPNTLKPELSVESNKVRLEPILLNSKDTITFKLLVTRFYGEIEPDARIMGVSKVKRVTRRSPAKEITVMCTLVLGLLLSLWAVSAFLGSLFQWSDSISWAVFLAAVLTTGIMFILIGVFGKKSGT